MVCCYFEVSRVGVYHSHIVFVAVRGSRHEWSKCLAASHLLCDVVLCCPAVPSWVQFSARHLLCIFRAVREEGD